MTGRYGAFSEKNYLVYALGNLLGMMGKQMLVVAIGWDIYEKTHSAMALGFVGLAQFIPVMLLTLPAGHVVDHYNRRKVLIASQVLSVACVAGLLLASWRHAPVEWMYLFLLLLGVSRSFHSPAAAALVPQIVTTENFTHAVTLNSIAFQVACIVGPAIAGLMMAATHSAVPVYIADLACVLLFLLSLLIIRQLPGAAKPQRKAISWESMLAGIRFIRSTPIILSAITLDLFAVLFGGAVTLLPVYAKDILHAGPSGLGWLQAAPAIGAMLMGIYLSRFAEIRRSGPLLMWMVTGFGIATIVFGLSTHFWLSFAMLFLIGTFDNVSVVIRQALVQLRTPDEMRGRVSAINYMFIGASNELGGFESGLVAGLFGPVFSVVSGGFATILTVLVTGCIWPPLRALDRLHEPEPEPASPPLSPEMTGTP